MTRKRKRNGSRKRRNDLTSDDVYSAAQRMLHPDPPTPVTGDDAGPCLVQGCPGTQRKAPGLGHTVCDWCRFIATATLLDQIAQGPWYGDKVTIPDDLLTPEGDDT